LYTSIRPNDDVLVNVARKNQIEYFCRSEDDKLDRKMLNDFLEFTEYSEEDFWKVVDKFANREIVEKREGVWRLKEPCK